MKKLFPIATLFLCWLMLTGMGVNPQGEIPVPVEDYKVTVVDSQSISTKCRKVSWNGRVSFSAKRGEASINIPFEKVKKVAFLGPGKKGKVDARISLRDGEVVAVTFSGEAKLYGTASFGTYGIRARNIKTLVFE